MEAGGGLDARTEPSERWLEKGEVRPGENHTCKELLLKGDECERCMTSSWGTSGEPGTRYIVQRLLGQRLRKCTGGKVGREQRTRPINRIPGEACVSTVSWQLPTAQEQSKRSFGLKSGGRSLKSGKRLLSQYRTDPSEESRNRHSHHVRERRRHETIW